MAAQLQYKTTANGSAILATQVCQSWATITVLQIYLYQSVSCALLIYCSQYLSVDLAVVCLSLVEWLKSVT